jgi:hypothetical protein
MERPPNPKEVRMSSSPFDFDVVTGPSTPREEPKAASRPGSAGEPKAGEPPAKPTPSK